MDVWEVRKQILYGDDACPSHLQSQSSVGDLGGVTGVDGHRSGKLDKRGKSVNVNVRVVYILVLIHVCVHVCVLVCVAPPMVVGAWSMAGALWQLFEYYYSCGQCTCSWREKLTDCIWEILLFTMLEMDMAVLPVQFRWSKQNVSQQS